MNTEIRKKNKDNQSNSLLHLLELSWQTMGYGLGIFGRQVMIYLTLPLFTRSMTKNEFGLISFVIATTSFLGTISNVGLPAATNRFYFESDDPKSQHQILGSSLVMSILLALIPAFVLLLFSGSISEAFLQEAKYSEIIKLSSVLLVLDTLTNYGLILLRIQIRPFVTSVTNVVIAISQMSIAGVLVLYYDKGPFGYILGLIFGSTIGLILIVFFTYPMLSIDISQEKVNSLLRYGVPLMPASISLWALKLIDRTFISSMIGLEEVAIYEIGYKIGMIVAMVITPIKQAWGPFAFNIMKRENAQKIYRDILTFVMSLSLFIALGLHAFKKEVLNFLAPADYSAALSIIGLVALAQVFNSCQMILSIGFKITKKTTSLAKLSIGATIIAILLYILLIPSIGIMGAALATLIGYILLAVGTYVFGKQYYPLSLDWDRIIRIIFATLASLFFISTIRLIDISGILLYLYKIIIWLSFPMICILFGVIDISRVAELWVMTTNFLQTKISPLVRDL